MVSNINSKKKGGSKMDIEVASVTSSTVHQSKPFKNPSFGERERKKLRNIKQIMDLTIPNYPTFNYLTIEAPPSLKPKRKYCDLTGLEAPYMDSSTGLYYHDMHVFKIIKSLSPNQVQQLLQIRNAAVILK